MSKLKRNLELLSKMSGFNQGLISTYEVGKEFTYTLEELKEGEVSRLEIRFNKSLSLPIMAIFDRHYMIWYGDYGSFSFDCTWKTSVMNLPYNTPGYLWEKLDRGCIRKEFVGAKKELKAALKEGDFYTYDLNEGQRKDFIDWVEGGCYSWDVPESIEEYEDVLDEITELYEASGDEYEWIEKIRGVEDDLSSRLFDKEPYALFSWGYEIPSAFYYILYILNLVAEDIDKNNTTEGETNG